MLKKKYPSILFIICLFLSISTLEILGQTKRDLSNYIKGPTFSYVWWRNSEEEQENLRQYIWEAWNKKQQVYFYMSVITREGDRNTSIFYIEKDKNNLWRIARKMEPGHCPFSKKKDCKKHFATELIYDTVKKVQEKNAYKIVLIESGKGKLEF